MALPGEVEVGAAGAEDALAGVAEAVAVRFAAPFDRGLPDRERRAGRAREIRVLDAAVARLRVAEVVEDADVALGEAQGAAEEGVSARGHRCQEEETEAGGRRAAEAARPEDPAIHARSLPRAGGSGGP